MESANNEPNVKNGKLGPSSRSGAVARTVLAVEGGKGV